MHFPVTDINRGDSCVQVTTNGRDFTHFHPLMSKGDAWYGLSALINKYGVPEKLTTDNAKEQGGGGAYKNE